MSKAKRERKLLASSLKDYEKSFKKLLPSLSRKEKRIIKSFFVALGTPKALAAWLLFDNNEHVQLLDLDVDPKDYLDWDSFHLDYLAVSFLSKADFLQTGYDTRQRAIDKFQLMELQCAETNKRFWLGGGIKDPLHARLLDATKRKIDQILGDFDNVEFLENPSWGPGSSTLIKGDDTSASRKFQSEIGITRSLYSLIGPLLPDLYPMWFDRERVSDSSFPCEEGNTVTTVRKNSKTDRVIAVEPGINLWFQKSAGSMIRRRLKLRGIDLNDQSKNQYLARISYLIRLATVDFSSASDSIAYRVVQALLPLRWFTVLDSLRCRRGKIGKQSFEWAKFSSMGNGFTFELESLIFYAAAKAVTEELKLPGAVSVYGDDVILPSAAYPTYRDFCAFLGFTVNTEKSFSQGDFFESCGAHWFRGHDVKPLYLKERLSHAKDVYKLANSIRRLAHRRNSNYGCDRRFYDCWHHISSGIPIALRRLRIPDGYGDGGLVCNFDEATPSRLRNQLEGFYTFTSADAGKRISVDYHGLLLDKLSRPMGLDIPFGSFCDKPGTVRFSEQLKRESAVLKRQTNGLSGLMSRNTVTLRNRTKSVITPLSVPSWYDLGPWI